MQRAAATAITQTRILQVLEAYAPLIVGTLPIDVHLPGSDLDIVCCAKSPGKFKALLRQRFGAWPRFAVRTTTLQQHPAVVCRFTCGSTLFEIVGMPVETSRQRAYIHLMVEADLLRLAGRRARVAIRRLKRQGLKTEPAIALCFGLGGKPYQAVEKLWRGNDQPLAFDGQRVTLVTTARLARPLPSLKSKRTA
ncbi:MAG: DUF4269 domain-containing protein [Alphaproteobacteria bacterium]|nr:DUF4269 domain-containing protein [Alphaproteobacteria bacterium]